MDYGHPIEFGYFLTPDAGDPVGVLETARLADRLGYDLIGVQDHPYQSRFFDTSSLLATILAQTEALRVFAAVGNLPLRPPAVLAKAAATLDLLSDGRFELGIGAGGYLEKSGSMTARRLRDLLVSSRLPDVADVDPRSKEEHHEHDPHI